MKKLLLLLILALIIPQVALAAWWNPFSWTRSEPKATQVIETGQMEGSEIINQNAPEPVVNDDVVEKVIERVITIDNPELRTQINALITENTSLKKQIASLTEQVRTLSSQQKETEKEPEKTYQSEAKPLVDKLETVLGQAASLEKLMAERCYVKTSPTDSTLVFSNSMAINLSDGFLWQGENKKWLACVTIRDQMIPWAEAEETGVLREIELLKIRYGI